MLVLVFVVCSVLAIGYRTVPEIVTRRILILCGWLCISAVLYIVTPFSAWTVGKDFDNPQTLIMQLRYVPTFLPLVVVLAVTVTIQVIRNDPMLNKVRTARTETRLIVTPMRQVTFMLFMLVLFVVGAGWRAITYEPLHTISSRIPEESGIYQWVTDNLHDSSILVYVEKQPLIVQDDFYPYLLYGDNLSNRVYFYVPTLDSWELETVQTFVDNQAVEYILLPAASEFDDFLEVYSVVYQDTYSTVLATDNP
jgi:hypothetical protein